jgi:hypothetical protein
MQLSKSIEIPVVKSSHAVPGSMRLAAFPGHKGLVLGTSDPLRQVLADAAREFGKDVDEWIPTGEAEDTFDGHAAMKGNVEEYRPGPSCLAGQGFN